VKVGDLVKFRGPVQRGTPIGLVMADMPPYAGCQSPRYKIWWMAQNKTGWWDSHKLKKVTNEG